MILMCLNWLCAQKHLMQRQGQKGEQPDGYNANELRLKEPLFEAPYIIDEKVQRGLLKTMEFFGQHAVDFCDSIELKVC